MASYLDGIGDRIKKRAKVLGLTQKELAVRAGLTKSNLNDIVTGKSDPGINKLNTIAKALEIDLAWLIYGKPLEQRKFGKEIEHGRRQIDRVPGMLEFIEGFLTLNEESRGLVKEIMDIYLRRERRKKKDL